MKLGRGAASSLIGVEVRRLLLILRGEGLQGESGGAVWDLIRRTVGVTRKLE